MEPEVSISCLAYNHGKYIRRMLESLVSQKTNFPFEILIHDDASTDNTAEIIREFEKKYPDIVKPIYQTENQYSKGVRISGRFQYPRIAGKYVAYCECDDFWCDENKLQLQYDYMESHPECAMCCHAADIVDENGEHVRYQRPFAKTRIVDVKNVLWDKRDYIPTASQFVKASLVKNKKPSYFRGAPIGDLTMQLLCAINGSVYYMDRVMSGYRINVGVSWTTKMSADTEKRAEFRKKLLKMFDTFDENTDFKYTQDVQIAKSRPEFEDALDAKDIKAMKSGLLRYHYRQLPLKSKLVLNIKSLIRR